MQKQQKPRNPNKLHRLRQLKRLNQFKRRRVLAAGVGLAVVLGLTTAGVVLSGYSPWSQWFKPQEQETTALDLTRDKNSKLLPLVPLNPAERAAKLEEIAQGNPSADRNRARYLLASDLIQQNHSKQALTWLDGLENDDPVLAAPVSSKRAQAYAATGDKAKAEATWKTLLQNYPKDPAAAEALFNLGQTNPQAWDQAIAQFPAHPRSIEIALARLEKNPDQPQMLLLIAQHGLYRPDIVNVLNRLKTEYGDRLTPQDWEIVAAGYWEKQFYGNASAAYAKAPPTALNVYRIGRGAQLAGRGNDAIAAYQRLAEAFPTAKETGQSLLRLADLVEDPQDAVPYLDQAIQKFPEQAAEALLKKSNVLQKLNSAESALQARQSVLSQYNKSETAAEIRWEQAEQNFLKGDTKAAWEWAQQLIKQNPDSTLAPEAAFWMGKWATALEKPKEAQQAFEYVLANYPESYYAWRSANLLGWDVGDFTSVRQRLPKVVKPTQYPEPLAGSATAKALYQLGQYQDAWSYWQVEFSDRVNPTVAEQFTDGLMRLGVSENLDGIFMLSSLAWRKPPNEQAEYQIIRRQPAYWQALYPFPFLESIEQWSQQRQLNPMLVTALVRQESRFEPKIESSAGAVGLMQVMPDTADWIGGQIDAKNFNLQDPNDNLKLGTWYLNYTHEQYENNSLFAVASYNAGPGNVSDWINQFSFSDPDKFVEQIPFDETKGYVKSVFENYWNYLRLYNPEISQKLAQYSTGHSALLSSISH